MIRRTFPFILLLCVSCHQTGSPPRGALSEDRFQSVYVALLEESEKNRALPADTARHFKADSIFRAFNTSESEFRATMGSYRSDPKKWQKFYEGVVRQLDEKQKQSTAKPRQ